MNTREVSNQALEAIARLSHDPDFRVFCDVLLTARKERLEDVAKLDEPIMIYRAQGAIGMVGEVIELVEQVEGIIRSRPR